jgi:hypothetical protein
MNPRSSIEKARRSSVKFRFVAIALLLPLVSGCGSAPRTIEEFRQNVSGGSVGFEKGTFVVNRPISDIAKTFDDRAKACLTNVRVDRTATLAARYGGQSKVDSFWYSSNVTSSSKSVEMYVRVKITGEKMIKVQDEPEGGYFVFLAEVTPVDKSHSSITAYSSKYRTHLLEGVKGWATGNSLKCPELDKDI